MLITKKMKKYICYITRFKFMVLITFFGTTLISCNHYNARIQDNLEKMMRSKVEIDIDSLEMFEGSDDEYLKCFHNAKLNWIVYYDSIACNACKIKSLQYWNDYIQLSKRNKYSIGFYFIFRKSIHKGDTEIIKRSVTESGLKCPIFIDTCGYFMRHNAFIPQRPLYQTFLVDDNYSPIIVGDPMNNVEINDLFYKLLEKRALKK